LNFEKTKGFAAVLGEVKGASSNEKFENHCSMVSSSALKSKSVSFSLFAAKMNSIENKNSNHLAAPCLPPYAMLQLL